VSLDDSVIKLTCHRLDDLGSNSGRYMDFSGLPRVQIATGVHPASWSVGIRALFPRNKVAET
jgi:hypothetical protein